MNWLSRPILRKRSVNEGTFREFRERGGGGWCTLARNIGNKKTFPPPEKWLLPPNIYFPSGSSTIGDKEVATPPPPLFISLSALDRSLLGSGSGFGENLSSTCTETRRIRSKEEEKQMDHANYSSGEQENAGENSGII